MEDLVRIVADPEVMQGNLPLSSPVPRGSCFCWLGSENAFRLNVDIFKDSLCGNDLILEIN
jgi:hypothetical protein